jgi:opacity protein-like surface antigen
MRYLLVLLSTTILSAGVTQTASAQSAWYISGSAGAYLRSDNSGSETISGSQGRASGTNTTTFDPGPVINVAVGYRLPAGLRLEGELGFTHYNIDSISPFTANKALFPFLNGSKLGVQSGGDLERYTQTINAFYDLPLPGRFVPYVGAGFGAAEDSGSDAYSVESGGVRTFTQRAANGVHPVILAEVGLNVTLDPKWTLVPAYRFEHIFASGDAAEENANVFKVGLRYSF